MSRTSKLKLGEDTGLAPDHADGKTGVRLNYGLRMPDSCTHGLLTNQPCIGRNRS